MIRLLVGITLLLQAAQDSPIDPADPVVKRTGQKWQVTFPFRAELPERTIVQMRVREIDLRYVERGRRLEWQIPENLPAARRARLRNGRAEIRTIMEALRRIEVDYFVDPEAQQGAKVKGPVRPVKKTFALGSSGVRLLGVRKGFETPEHVEKRLRRALDDLEKAAESKDPGPGANTVVSTLNSLRDRCEEAKKKGHYTATMGLLESVIADAITYASWLANRTVMKSEKYGSDAKVPGAGTGPGGGKPLDDPEGGEGGGGSPPEPTGGVDRGNANMKNQSVANLRRRLDVLPPLRRSEAFLRLLTETRDLVEAECDTDGYKPVRETLEFLAKQYRDDAPSDVVPLLREFLTTVTPEERKLYMDRLKIRIDALHRIRLEEEDEEDEE